MVDVLDAGEKSTCVKSFPIGIDASDFQAVAARPRSNRIVSQTISGLGSRKLIIGVDRLDYSKGIPQRMEAYERFLLNNSDQRGHVTYLQIAPTSRSEVPEYGTLSRVVNETLGRINGSLGEPAGYQSTTSLGAFIRIFTCHPVPPCAGRTCHADA